MSQSALPILQELQYPLNTAEGPSQEALECVGQLVPIGSRSLPFRLIGRHLKGHGTLAHRDAPQILMLPSRPTQRHAVAT